MTDRPMTEPGTPPWWSWDTDHDDSWLAEFSGEDIRALVRERNRLLAIEAQAAAPEQDEAVSPDEAALNLVHRLSEPRMKAWLSSHVTGMHWGCGVTEDEGDCMVAQLAALASPPPVPAALDVEQLTEACRLAFEEDGVDLADGYGWLARRILARLTTPEATPAALDVDDDLKIRWGVCGNCDHSPGNHGGTLLRTPGKPCYVKDCRCPGYAARLTTPEAS